MKRFLLTMALLTGVARADSLPTLDVPRAVTAPKISAAPLDSAWVGAATFPQFTLSKNTNADLKALPTSVKALWNEEFLYFRFECQDADILAPFDGIERDQPLYQGDVVEIFLDVVGDGRQVFEFQFSPKNQIFDQNIVLTTEPRADENFKLLPEVLRRDFWINASWNCEGLKSAASRTESGWIVDVALPVKPVLKRLGQDTFAPMTLRANVLRYDWQNKRLAPLNWASVLNGCPHISPGAMGFLRLQE